MMRGDEEANRTVSGLWSKGGAEDDEAVSVRDWLHQQDQ